MPPEEMLNGLLCVDGQQRMTTTMLLIAAMRDAALEISASHPKVSEQATAVLTLLHTVLYRSDPGRQTFEEYVAASVAAQPHSWEQILPSGQSLPFPRLVPSYADRQPFYECILRGALLHAGLAMPPGDPTTLQLKVKDTFDRLVQDSVANCEGPLEAIEWIHSRSQSALRMSLMYVQPLNKLNLAQVFLYLQEKSLLSPGALLHNPNPGVKFNHSDLVRNQLLSPFMNESQAIQSQVHTDLWLEPFELHYGTIPELNGMIASFLDDVDRRRQVGRDSSSGLLPPPRPDSNAVKALPMTNQAVVKMRAVRNVSKIEENLYAIRDTPALVRCLGDLTGMHIFGRFCSLYEETVARPEHSHAQQQQITRQFVEEMKQFRDRA